MNVLLLTHERELGKKTNTGDLVLSCFSSPLNSDDKTPSRAQRILWQRTEPNGYLLDKIAQNEVALLYPASEGESVESVENFETFIVLDSTWQESRKIINKSPYLKTMPKVSLSSGRTSNFQRRKNQVPGGLCTAECVLELLKLKGRIELAEQLEKEYEHFNSSQ